MDGETTRESIIIDEQLYVTRAGCMLLVCVGQTMDTGHGRWFAFNPGDVEAIIPGVPMAALLPLATHQTEIRAIVRRGLLGTI